MVTTLIYWDANFDIDNDEIAVYNINGEKIESRENISIDKLSSFSGFLIWNCSKTLNGIYFILIKHGNNLMTLKLLIAK